MCISCQNKKQQKFVKSLPFPIKTTSCNKTEQEIEYYIEKMECLKEKIKAHDWNKYKGLLLSMIQLRQYCRYDVLIIDVLLEKYGCA